MRAAWWVPAVGLLALGCGPRIDVEAAKRAILDADLAFAQATAERGGEGWASYFAEDGRQYPARGVVIGRDSIRRFMTPVLADTLQRLDWQPAIAVMSRAADLGYTLGRWERSGRTAAGSWEVQERGNYVTIWQKQADGSWKVALDIGNPDPPAATPGPGRP